MLLEPDLPNPVQTPSLGRHCRALAREATAHASPSGSARPPRCMGHRVAKDPCGAFQDALRCHTQGILPDGLTRLCVALGEEDHVAVRILDAELAHAIELILERHEHTCVWFDALE